jgi:hypothetical protein
MAGYLLHVGATVRCAHGGDAKPTISSPRVSLGGQAAVTTSGPYLVSGCAMPPPIAGNGPCVSATWLMGATRVKIGGAPALLLDSQALCAPTGTPLLPVQAQMRVKGM